MPCLHRMELEQRGFEQGAKEEAGHSSWARSFQWDFITWLSAVRSQSLSLCILSCAQAYGKAKYWWGYLHAPISVPTVSLMGVIGIDRRDATKDICPVMVKNPWGKGLSGLLLPNLQLFLQTGKHWVVIIFLYQINHIAFIQKLFCVNYEVSNWLSLVFKTCIISKHLLVL